MSIANLQFGFAMSGTIFERSVAGISDEESRKAPQITGNCINWIVGHLLWARSGVLHGLLGLSPLSDALNLEPYRRGTSALAADCASGIPFEKLTQAMIASNKQLAEGLAKLTEADLERAIDPSYFPFPVEHPTTGNMLTLVLVHESYHIGQIGLSRRLLGKPSGLGA